LYEYPKKNNIRIALHFLFFISSIHNVTKRKRKNEIIIRLCCGLLKNVAQGRLKTISFNEKKGSLNQVNKKKNKRITNNILYVT
jgi:hypothetical protein